MSKLKQPKQAKLPKKPFKNEEPREKRISGAEKKLNKEMLKEALKRKQKREKTINRSLGIAAVLLCIISSILDVIIRKADKIE